MNAPAPVTQSDPSTSESNNVAFTFVQALAAELSGGKVELPGFPHIVMRVQKVLADDTADSARIVRVIGSEPVLATQLVRMANSAALNPGGANVTDLRAAVSRVGIDTVRSATIAFAIQQLKDAPALKGLARKLKPDDWCIFDNTAAFAALGNALTLKGLTAA